MSCLVWNCLGLGIPQKVPVLKKEILSKGPVLVLCKTKLLVEEMRRLARILGFDCCFGVDCDVSGGGRKGGLGLLWKAEDTMVLHSFSPNHIDVRVGEVDRWRFTWCYGFPEEGHKWKSWRLLERLAEGCDLPWLCAGDFNEILRDHEKSGGVIRNDSKVRDFRNCLDNCDLTDLCFVGHPLT